MISCCVNKQAQPTGVSKRAIPGLLAFVHTSFSRLQQQLALQDSLNFKPGLVLQMDLQDRDCNRPAYHVQPCQGWLNDPNGPIYFKGQYHVFFQHVPDSNDWQWRIQWGHCVSEDLIHWRRLPSALTPSSKPYDKDGCWSGCCTVDTDGKPYLIYTGVSLNNPQAPARIMSPQQESVCWAGLNDDNNQSSQNDLIEWSKKGILIEQAPSEIDQVYGWRDPYVFRKGDGDGVSWGMVIGAGEYQKAGMVLMYEAEKLAGPWKYMGKVIEFPTSEVGTVCECPFLVKLPTVIENGKLPMEENIYLLAAGAYEYQKFHPEALCQPVWGWIGNLNDNKFKVLNGPFALDYGDAYYAPTCCQGQEQNEVILWAWMLETNGRYNKEKYDYSGCLGIPRIIKVNTQGELLQLPHPKLQNLREKIVFNSAQELVSKQISFQGLRIELRIMFEAMSVQDPYNFMLITSNEGTQLKFTISTEGFQILFIDYDGEVNKKLLLPLSQKGQRQKQVEFILYLDGSLVECFSGQGQSLSTRFYSEGSRVFNLALDKIECCKVWSLKENVVM
eukprot:TRINITY_DN3075_c0_g1_i5.p1 TRINITY_DN3075_c0_g1~~TRINITY_DN3075_c0_g1_i5.p1  ORF type:complete len:557 (+),score=48.93 TRINITY_DN3075_c0_g1_i5:105-1775(+)